MQGNATLGYTIISIISIAAEPNTTGMFTDELATREKHSELYEPDVTTKPPNGG